MDPPSVVEHDSARKLAIELAEIDLATESNNRRKRWWHVVTVTCEELG